MNSSNPFDKTGEPLYDLMVELRDALAGEPGIEKYFRTWTIEEAMDIVRKHKESVGSSDSRAAG